MPRLGETFRTEIKFGISAWVVVLLLVFSIIRVGGSHHDEKKGKGRSKKLIETPEFIISLRNESVNVSELAELGGSCNLSKYTDSEYNKAWLRASRHDFSEAAELFNTFETVIRKGRDKSWRQEVCDSWPYSLMQCESRGSDPNSNATCTCLRTRLTKFRVEEEVIQGKRIKVCRVKVHKKCSTKSTSLKCEHKHHCLSGVCEAASLEPSTALFLLIMAVLCFSPHDSKDSLVIIRST